MTGAHGCSRRRGAYRSLWLGEHFRLSGIYIGLTGGDDVGVAARFNRLKRDLLQLAAME
ncbi:hypothetical protein M404DRAFT_215778 [Pisolithus tinctorius Marx 270]|uniref:Uncharacterized protein n=1 Tax=Pisolithus tinctorius Marx 270 TaxID=870435 RepID=A0A0C3PNA4_PISTI|nr:hypothetical protein M404DRAFT_215778 [Pisolithus tinctorius Marx 270]